jgi:hypothetical protein
MQASQNHAVPGAFRGQEHEVRYEAKKSGKSKGEVKQAVKRAGPSRKKVEKDLGKSRVQVALYS